MKIVLATRNPGKVAEIRALLGELPVDLISAAELRGAPEVEEDEGTLEGNAFKKAQVLHEITGLATLADDTGLEVSALDGRPGVRSARFAGAVAGDADNRRLLLKTLAEDERRTARFRTVVAFIDDEGLHHFEGICTGKIARQERGSAGFGYDSIFVPDGMEKTFAELNGDEKNAVSHRGRALRELASYLQDRLEGR